MIQDPGEIPLFEDDLVPQPAREPSRYSCLTGLLVCLLLVYGFIAIVNAIALANADSAQYLRERMPGVPGWFVPAVSLCAALNVIWLIALLRWQKWGLYAFVLTAIAMAAIHILVGAGPRLETGFISVPWRSLLCAVEAVAVFVLLRLGGPRSAWHQLG